MSGLAWTYDTPFSLLLACYSMYSCYHLIRSLASNLYLSSYCISVLLLTCPARSWDVAPASLGLDLADEKVRVPASGSLRRGHNYGMKACTLVGLRRSLVGTCTYAATGRRSALPAATCRGGFVQAAWQRISLQQRCCRPILAVAVRMVPSFDRHFEMLHPQIVK